jgi:hypothetical protein
VPDTFAEPDWNGRRYSYADSVAVGIRFAELHADSVQRQPCDG